MRSSRRWQRADAEDIAGNAVAKAWERRREYDRARGALQAWVWTITKRSASNEARDRRRRGPHVPLTEVVPATDPDDDLTPRGRAVREAISKLDKKTRELIYDHYWKRWSFKRLAGGNKRAYNRIRQTAARGYASIRRSVGLAEHTSSGHRGSSGRSGETEEHVE
jgi:RNA polymerase sigma factor (sigma-70 family)